MCDVLYPTLFPSSSIFRTAAMAPRRHAQNPAQGILEADLLDADLTRCCVPTGDCLRANSVDSPAYALISLDDLRDTVRVTCNNESCTVGRYMHRECFEAWEQSVLTYLKSCGRARSWSERQRHQNLWTKKGYDLAFKACGCRCGRGHLKKDLDWMPPPPTSGLFGRVDDQDGGLASAGKKKKRRNRGNSRPTLSISAVHPVNAYHGNGGNAVGQDQLLRGRAGSLSSSTGSSSPPVSASSEQGASPLHNATGALKKKSSATKIDFFSDRIRAGSGANGIFSRRLDFSSFNLLPRHKLNSYHIKMEDEGNHGNDDTRCFILSTLAAQQRSRVTCVLCDEIMPVFDRYPLVDGTFFLSPKQHAKGCQEVKVEGRTQYLSAVCMACLEASSPERAIRCRFCASQWDGSSLVLGTMYSYDIFAAMPCCAERHKCNNCFKPLLHPHQRLNFFSDYSHTLNCPFCHVQDTHFVKPLAYCYTKQTFPLYQQWP